MSEPSKVTGTKDRVVGAVKESAGRLFGSERTEAEGHAQNVRGRSEVDAARAQQEQTGRAEILKGNIKESVGNLCKKNQSDREFWSAR